MKNTLKVTNTAYPDGTVVMYLHGMNPPSVKNLGQLMKLAAFKAVTSESVQTHIKIESHLSKAG